MGELKAFSRSPLQNSMAINMPKPIDPLIKTLSIMEVGTATEAFVISSDIYQEGLVNQAEIRVGKRT